MANRNFRKNLALLCALAGGAAALSSINVSTSAMEDEPSNSAEENTRKLVNDFKQLYNSHYANLQGKNYYTKKFQEYTQIVSEPVADFLLASASSQMSKDYTLAALETEKENQTQRGDNNAAKKIELLAEKLMKKRGINWTTSGVMLEGTHWEHADVRRLRPNNE